MYRLLWLINVDWMHWYVFLEILLMRLQWFRSRGGAMGSHFLPRPSLFIDLNILKVKHSGWSSTMVCMSVISYPVAALKFFLLITQLKLTSSYDMRPKGRLITPQTLIHLGDCNVTECLLWSRMNQFTHMYVYSLLNVWKTFSTLLYIDILIQKMYKMCITKSSWNVEWIICTGKSRKLHIVKHFPRYWPFVRGIHRWQVISPHKD